MQDQGSGPEPTRRGHIESTAATVERARETVLAALGKTYSIVVLASLSLVVAAFARTAFPDAVSFAVAASSAFFIAVLLTVIHEVRRSARPVFHIELGIVTIVSIAAGFVMLGLVVAVIAWTDSVTRRVTLLLLGTITLVAFGSAVLMLHETTDRVQRADPGLWARHGPYLRLAPWVAVAGWLVLAATLVLTVLNATYPQVLVGAGLLGFLAPLVYVREVGQASVRTRASANRPNS